MFGILLLVEKLWLGKVLDKLPNLVKRIYVLFIVMISFIIFNGPTLKEAWSNIAGLFGVNCNEFINEYTIYYLKSYLVTFIIAIIEATPILKKLIEKLKKYDKILNICELILIPILLIIVTSYLVDSSYNPFLYFRF